MIGSIRNARSAWVSTFGADFFGDNLKTGRLTSTEFIGDFFGLAGPRRYAFECNKPSQTVTSPIPITLIRLTG